MTEIAGERSARFDNKGDRFYDLISALHKSVRGSAPDAALYWYARIITAGGDPLYVARRCLAIASEDVGNADPRAMQVALSAWDCFTRVVAGLCHFLREILLPGRVSVGFIVSVTILLPVPHLFHQLRWRITQMHRHIVVRALTRIRHSPGSPDRIKIAL